MEKVNFVKPNQVQNVQNEIQEKPLVQRLKEAEQMLGIDKNNNQDPKKINNIRIPRKAKVRRRRAKKGWVGILTIDKAKNIFAEKQLVEGSTIKLKDGTYHSLENDDVFYWNGRYPLILQPKEKNMAWNPLKILRDETYGQAYIKARMLKDVIKEKGKGGFTGFIWLIVIVAIGYGAGKLFRWW